MEDLAMPVLKTAQETKPGIFVFKARPVIGIKYTTACPKCSKSFEVQADSTEATIVQCPHCNQRIGMRGKTAEKKVDIPAGSEKKPTNKDNTTDNHTQSLNTSKIPVSGFKGGELHWRAKFIGCPLIPKSYKLHEGKNIIGRKDSSLPSDLNLEDQCISRQSICINMMRTDNGYMYKMQVLNAANPVYLCGKKQAIGSDVFLNDNDTIRMGNTTLTFKLAK